MSSIGFVPPPVLAPVVGPIINFVGLAATTVGAAIGINKVVDAITPEPPQTTVGGDISFTPWGDDPYEDPPLPEPAPSMAPIAESTSAPVAAPPPTPTPIPPKPDNAQGNTDPQTVPEPAFVPAPIPVAPGGGEVLGGYSFSANLGTGGAGVKLELSMGGKTSPVISTSWTAVSYEVHQEWRDAAVVYLPRIRVMNGSTTKYLWAPLPWQQTIPSISLYGTTVIVPGDDGSSLTLPIAEFASYTETNHLPRTFQPLAVPPKPLPQVDEEPLAPIPEPLPEVEPLPDTDLPLPGTLAPPVPDAFPYPTPGFTPIPLTPDQQPILDEQGRPVRPTRPVVIPPDTHVITTPGGTLPVPGSTARPTLTSVAKEVARIESKSAQLLKNTNGGGGVLEKLPEILLLLQGLADLFEAPLPSKEYSITGVCEEPLADGKQPSTTVVLPPEKY